MPIDDNVSFEIRPNGEPILLYGENAFSKETYTCLNEKGYDVKGYIDRKYTGCRIENGIFRIGLDGIERNEIDFTDYIVIICLQNGLEHEKMAGYLFRKRFRKIIYLPMQLRRSTLRRQEEYRRIYHSVQNFQYENIGRVPFYLDDNDSQFIIIDRQAFEITFWCPAEYLYSSTIEMMQNSQKEVEPELMEYADVRMQEFEPYIALFKWLAGNRDANIKLYLDATSRKSLKEREEYLKDRKYLFQIYEDAFHYNMGFFLDSPAHGVWNPNGYFNVLDGLHRLHYLYSKGYRQFPLAVKHEEYKAFISSANIKFVDYKE